jgi:hypothetical protein
MGAYTADERLAAAYFRWHAWRWYNVSVMALESSSAIVEELRRVEVLVGLPEAASCRAIRQHAGLSQRALAAVADPG